MKNTWLWASALLILLVFATPVRAEQVCMPHMLLHTTLEDNWQEYVRSTSELPNGNLFFVYANLRTGTWTAVEVSATEACVIVAGEGFELTDSGL